MKETRPWWEALFDEDYFHGYSHLEERTDEEADAIREALSLRPDETLLDVPCGQGRHARRLAEAGVRVTGLDLSSFLIGRAREAGCGRLVRGDMRSLPFPDGTFDAAMNVFTSFGYFSEEENAEVLEEIARCLRPGGRFLLESLSRDGLFARGPAFPRRMWHEGEGVRLLDEVTFEGATSRTETRRLILREDGTSREVRFSVRLYTERELRGLLEAAGFEEVEVGAGLLDTDPYRADRSFRMTVQARRPS